MKVHVITALGAAALFVACSSSNKQTCATSDTGTGIVGDAEVFVGGIVIADKGLSTGHAIAGIFDGNGGTQAHVIRSAVYEVRVPCQRRRIGRGDGRFVEGKCENEKQGKCADE